MLRNKMVKTGSELPGPLIWHLSSNRWNSAITEYVLSTQRAFGLEGFRNAFTPLAGSPAEVRAQGLGLETYPLGGFSIKHLPAALRIAKELRPDIIMVYGGPETVLSKFLMRSDKKVSVVRFRGQALPASSSFSFLTKNRWSHSHVTCILAPSAALATQLQKVFPKTSVNFVPLGCDAKRFFPVACHEPIRRPEVIILGRLDLVKGHRKAFQIFAQVLKKWPSERSRPLLHVVGESANLSVTHLRQYLLEAGLAEGQDVKITAERVHDIARLMSAAALGLVSSLDSEIICRVAEEFLLCGTPVVVSGAGSLDEVLLKGAGVSYRGLDDNQAAACIQEWLLRSLNENDQDKLERAQRAREVFSLEAMGLALHKALRSSGALKQPS